MKIINLAFTKETPYYDGELVNHYIVDSLTYLKEEVEQYKIYTIIEPTAVEEYMVPFEIKTPTNTRLFNFSMNVETRFSKCITTIPPEADGVYYLVERAFKECLPSRKDLLTLEKDNKGNHYFLNKRFYND